MNENALPVYHVTRAFIREKAVVVRIKKRKKLVCIFVFQKFMPNFEAFF